MKLINEKELMEIVFAILEWRQYLLGRISIVRTDQSSLRFLLDQRIIEAEYQRWITKIMGFDSSNGIDWRELDEQVERD